MEISSYIFLKKIKRSKDYHSIGTANYLQYEFKNSTLKEQWNLQYIPCSYQGKRITNYENSGNVIKNKYKYRVYGELNLYASTAFGDAFGKAIVFLIQDGK